MMFPRKSLATIALATLVLPAATRAQVSGSISATVP